MMNDTIYQIKGEVRDMYKTKKSLLSIAVTLVLVMGVFCTTGIEVFAESASPAKAVIECYENMNNSKLATSAKVNVTVEIDENRAFKKAKMFENYTKDQAKIIFALLKKVNLTADVKIGARDKSYMPEILQENISLNYDNKSLLEYNIVFKPWEYTYHLPQLSEEKVLTFNLDGYMNHVNKMQNNLNNYVAQPKPEVVEENGEAVVEATPLEEAVVVEESFDFSKIDMAKFMEILLVDDELIQKVRDDKRYQDIFYALLEGKTNERKSTKLHVKVNNKTNRTYKVQNYAISLSFKDLMNAYTEILVATKDDENIKALMDDRCLKMIEQIKSEEALTEEEIASGIQTIEELQANYPAAIEALVTTLNTDFIEAKDAEDILDAKIDALISIDEENKMRAANIVIDFDWIKIKEDVIYNAYGEDVKIIDKTEKLEKIDITSLADDPVESNKLSNELMLNFLNSIVKNSAVKNMIVDTKLYANTYLDEEEADKVIQSADQFMNTVKVLIQFLENPQMMAPTNVEPQPLEAPVNAPTTLEAPVAE